MNIRIFIALAAAFPVAPIAFGQMYGGQNMQSATQPQQQTGSGSQKMTTTTTTRTVFPVGVKGYLDSQMASSKDHRFHMSVNGRDLALTPVRYHDEQKAGGSKSLTAVDLKGADGQSYEMNFITSGGVVTDGKIVKINGKAP
jgi:hypothetical protein